MSARERFRQVLAGIPTLGRTTTAGARRNSRRIARRKTVERFIARREEGKRVFPARFRLDFGKGRSCGTNGRTIVALKSISSNNRDLSIREVGTSTRDKKRVDETRGRKRREIGTDESKQERGIVPVRFPRENRGRNHGEFPRSR